MADTASKNTGSETVSPTNKVIAAGATGAVVTILVWLINTYSGQKIPAEVAAALTVVLSSLAAYFKAPSADQTTVPTSKAEEQAVVAQDAKRDTALEAQEAKRLAASESAAIIAVPQTA
jgi:hypothetical protein